MDFLCKNFVIVKLLTVTMHKNMNFCSLTPNMKKQFLSHSAYHLVTDDDKIMYLRHCKAYRQIEMGQSPSLFAPGGWAFLKYS